MADEQQHLDESSTMLDRLRTWARNGHVPTALANDLKDAADEIERLRQFVDFVNLWAWRETKISDSERLDVIRWHPTARAALSPEMREATKSDTSGLMMEKQMSEFHWKDGWIFERTDAGMRIYNEVLFIDLLIPHNEWLSILKSTNSLMEAVQKVALAER